MNKMKNSHLWDIINSFATLGTLIVAIFAFWKGCQAEREANLAKLPNLEVHIEMIIKRDTSLVIKAFDKTNSIETVSVVLYFSDTKSRPFPVMLESTGQPGHFQNQQEIFKRIRESYPMVHIYSTLSIHGKICYWWDGDHQEREHCDSINPQIEQVKY